MARTADATADYRALLGSRVRLVVDSATRIDTSARKVLLESGDTLEYDYVIYAVGSTGAAPAEIRGAAEFAFPLGEFEPAQRLRAAIEASQPNAPITVVGAGLTGIETNWPRSRSYAESAARFPHKQHCGLHLHQPLIGHPELPCGGVGQYPNLLGLQSPAQPAPVDRDLIADSDVGYRAVPVSPDFESAR